MLIISVYKYALYKRIDLKARIFRILSNYELTFNQHPFDVSREKLRGTFPGKISYANLIAEEKIPNTPPLLFLPKHRHVLRLKIILNATPILIGRK